jgi:hypothetical protein
VRMNDSQNPTSIVTKEYATPYKQRAILFISKLRTLTNY